MQCRNCQFENMPGLDSCGRCGSSLHLATAVIDVHPPRASTWSKRARSWIPFRGVFVARDQVAQAVQQLASGLHASTAIVMPPLPVMARTIVPGWALIYSGHSALGWIFFGVYLGFLALGMLFWGTVLGSFLLGFAFSAHVSATLSVLWNSTADVRSRLFASGLVMFCLGICVYGPVLWLLGNVASPQTVAFNAEPLKMNDVLLHNRWAYLRSSPQVGDVVLYRNEHYPLISRPGLMHTVFRFQGNHIDRIVAGPGDRVVLKQGQLAVNGIPATRLPLNPDRLPETLEVTVPRQSYAIFPTASPRPDTALTIQQWQTLCIIPITSIEGTVYLRHQPLSRWWWIR